MIIILMIIAGACNAIMDTLQFRFDKSIFKNRNLNFWDPKKSWINKYKQPLKPYKKKWYYFGIVTPKFEELFPFSTTIFVSLTDAWHLFQKITWSCLIGAIVLYEPVNIKIVDFAVYYAIFTTSFTIYFSNILVSK
jgi:hypothetical protein